MAVQLTSAQLEARPVWRVVSTIYPPIDLFERVADRDDFDAVIDLEIAFSPRYSRLLAVQGGLPREEWVFGPGAGYIMAPFVYRQPSRFSDGSFGVFYAGLEEETALAERAHHLARFYASTNDRARLVDELILRAKVTAELSDLRGHQGQLAGVYDPVVYEPGQALGSTLRNAGREGLVYDSVRHPDGGCVAVFRPKAVFDCRQSRNITLEWDASRGSVRWA